MVAADAPDERMPRSRTRSSTPYSRAMSAMRGILRRPLFYLLIVLLFTGWNVSYAWYTNTASPLDTAATAAKVKLTGPTTEQSAAFSNITHALVNTEGLVPGQTVTLPEFSIENHSNRELLLEISLDMSAYLKMMDFSAGAGFFSVSPGDLHKENQNSAYTFSADGGPYHTPKAYYEGLVGTLLRSVGGLGTAPVLDANETWRSTYPAVSTYVYIPPTASAIGSGNTKGLYMKVDDALINACTGSGIDAAAKIGYGSRHFNGLRHETEDRLMKALITIAVREISGDPVLTPDFSDSNINEGALLTYLGASTGPKAYFKRGDTKFYVFLEAPDPNGPRPNYQITGVKFQVPKELCGDTSNSHWPPAKYQAGMNPYENSATGRSWRYAMDENEAGDAPETARLNEQQALFLLSFSARSVHGTKAAVCDVFANARLSAAYASVLT